MEDRRQLFFQVITLTWEDDCDWRMRLECYRYRLQSLILGQERKHAAMLPLWDCAVECAVTVTYYLSSSLLRPAKQAANDEACGPVAMCTRLPLFCLCCADTPLQKPCVCKSEH